MFNLAVTEKGNAFTPRLYPVRHVHIVYSSMPRFRLGHVLTLQGISLALLCFFEGRTVLCLALAGASPIGGHHVTVLPQEN